MAINGRNLPGSQFEYNPPVARTMDLIKPSRMSIVSNLACRLAENVECFITKGTKC